MTSDKARKQAIRAGMDATGERYTVAARRYEQEQVEAATIATALAATGPQCPRCTEGRLTVGEQGEEAVVHCSHCKAAWASGAEAAEEYAGEILGRSSYDAAMNGGREPVESCPECHDDALVWASFEPPDGDWLALCFTCGEGWNDTCMNCDRPIIYRGEGDLTICNGCFDYLVDKE